MCQVFNITFRTNKFYHFNICTTLTKYLNIFNTGQFFFTLKIPKMCSGSKSMRDIYIIFFKKKNSYQVTIKQQQN